MTHAPVARERYRSRSRRPATTLVELIVVISVAAIVFATLATLMTHLLRAESQTRDHIPNLGALSQLADRFRADTHRATRTEPSDLMQAGAGEAPANPEDTPEIAGRQEPRPPRTVARIPPDDESGATAIAAVRLTRDDGELIEYAIEPSQIWRTVTVDGQTQSRSVYPLPKQCTADIRSFPREGQQFLQLRLLSEGAVQTRWQCAAQVGRDHRWMRSQTP